MPDTETLGTEQMPYDPDDPVHEAIVNAEQVKKAAEEVVDSEPITLNDVFKAIRELTVQVGKMAKEQKEMVERHDKWIKAGKF